MAVCWATNNLDEISLVLIDYQTLTTNSWLDYQVEKICSIAASMATLAFNTAFIRNVKMRG